MSLIVTTLVVPAARPGRVRPLAAPRALHERGARSPRAARAERAAVFASSLYATMTSAKWGRRRADEHFSPAVVLSSEGLLGLLPDASGRNRQALAAVKRERVVFRCYCFTPTNVSHAVPVCSYSLIESSVTTTGRVLRLGYKKGRSRWIALARGLLCRYGLAHTPLSESIDKEVHLHAGLTALGPDPAEHAGRRRRRACRE